MAHFAKLDANNIVEKVIVVDNDDIKDGNGDESEAVGITFCKNLFGSDTNWKQTSYTADGNGFRGRYAGIGFTYMTNVQTLGVASTDIFIEQESEFPASWSIGVDSAIWFPPITQPTLTDSEASAGKFYVWDENAYNADTGSPKTIGWVLTDP